MPSQQEEGDWEITKEGLYVATRSFLVRRGYCCANRCRNCPYINWRDQPEWQPIPPERVQCTRVSSKAIEGASICLQQHQRQLQRCATTEQERHRAMIDHYHLLLERWGVET